MQPLRIGVAGLGTVGGGVVKTLIERWERLAAVSGRQLQLTVVSALELPKGLEIGKARWENDAMALASAPDVDVVVELIGGAEGIARKLVEAALTSGKHVVTANKALIAAHGATLARIAEDKKVALAFEAAVAGGIPIIKTLREGLIANEIESVTGILNGTCNYILTEMETTGRDFADVLKDAQKLGYAEADPTFDVGGIDAAHKLAILSSLAFGTAIDLKGVSIEGIERISAVDIRFAREFGYKIKLLGIARRTASGIIQRVHPALVAEKTAIARVSGVFNAVAIQGDRVGLVVLEGRGAGERPTASAVVADIADVARGIVTPPFILPVASLKKPGAAANTPQQGAYYLRLHAADRAGSMAEITRALAQASVSIERIVQRGEDGESKGRLPVVFVTHKTDEDTMQKALALLAEHEDVAGDPLMIRIVDTESR